MKIQLTEIHASDPSKGRRSIEGELIRVANGVAYVKHDPGGMYVRAQPWTIPLSMSTGRPGDGTDWAWCAEPGELARAAKELIHA